MAKPRPVAPRRVPAGDEQAILMRVYGYAFKRTGTIKWAEPSRDSDDLAAVSQYGWPVAKVESWTLADFFDGLISAADQLEDEQVMAAFVAGLQSAPRGRQVMVSYAFARALKRAPRGDEGYPDWGYQDDYPPQPLDVTKELLRIGLGWAWDEGRERYLVDLQAAVAQGLPEPTAADRQQLAGLLDVIRSQPAGTLPSQLERAVAREKLLPGTDKYQRYGIFMGLTHFGAMPSTLVDHAMWDSFVAQTELVDAANRAKGGPRSDISVPFAGWRGGLNEQRAAQLLAI